MLLAPIKVKHIYLFSGLGADERVFQFLDFKGYATTFIRWIDVKPKESIESYTKRLLEQVTTPNPILIGMSFGGMIAVEASKIIKTDKIILLASVKSRKELPPYFKGTLLLPLIDWLPASILLKPNPMLKWLFGIEGPVDSNIFKAILHDTDARFLRWAMRAISTWRHNTPTDNLIHIHGSADRVFPLKFIKGDFVLPNAGHFMAVNRAAKVSSLVRAALL